MLPSERETLTLPETIHPTEIADRLRWSMRRVYACLADGTIPAFRVGRGGKGGRGAWVILRSQFEAWVRLGPAMARGGGN